MAEATGVEYVADLTFKCALSIVVETSLFGCLSCKPINVLLHEVFILITI